MKPNHTIQWLRLYHSVLNDPKVQAMPGEEFKAWINVMLASSMNSPRGQVPESKQLAFLLHLEPIAAQELCQKLLNRGLLDKKRNRILVHAWDSRQFVSDSSYDRLVKFRSKRNVSETANETFHETQNETFLKRHQSRAETDAEQSRADLSSPSSAKASSGEDKTHERQKPALAFARIHLQVTEAQDRTLAEAFPWLDRQAQYCLAESWLEANPARRPKLISRFLHNWFERANRSSGGKHERSFSKNDPDIVRRAVENLARRRAQQRAGAAGGVARPGSE